jgi:alpha-amylase
LVENQRAGGANFRYRYRDAAGGDGGRFPKDPDNFHPQVPQDPGVFGGPRAREDSFGDDLAVINARPNGYVAKGLTDALGWMVRALDVQGFRLDDAKGVSTQFVPRLLGAPATNGKFAVAEFFDGDSGLLQQWLGATNRRAAAFDFPLRFTLARMCNQSQGFDMGGSLDHVGLAGADPLSAVTFVENHDTDTRPELQPVVTGKLLAYAYILTSEGYPCVFYKDYSTDPGCYGMKAPIDNLIWVHERLAFGPTVERWKEVGLFAYERLGGPHLLVGLNKDDWQWRTITVDTGFGANVRLHDYSGHGPDTQTGWDGRATISIPPNRGGAGYVCYSRDGQGGAFELREHPVTQEMEGAPDLDIAPAGAGAPRVAGQIWVDQGRAISVRLAGIDDRGLGPDAALEVVVHDPEGGALVAGRFKRPGATVVHTVAARRGGHRITVQALHTPVENRTPAFRLEATYTAPASVPLAALADPPA